MKLKFKATRWRGEYWSQDYHLRDGDEIDVHPTIAEKFLGHLKDNFIKIDPPEIKLQKIRHGKLTLSDISVISICNLPNVLQENLLPSIPKKVEFIKLSNEKNNKWTSAASALNYGIRNASNDIIICAHQDIVLGENWFDNFLEQEAQLRNWGALGIVGLLETRKLIWGNRLKQKIPYKAQTLDECCIIINRKNNIWFDEKNFDNWHCYAIDYCLQCLNKELGVFIIAGEAIHREGQASHSAIRNKLPHYMQKIQKKWSMKFPNIHTSVGEIRQKTIPTHPPSIVNKHNIKVMFKKTVTRKEYWSQDLHLKDKNIVDLRSMLANRLLKNFPDNFVKIEEVKPKPKIKTQQPKIKIQLPKLKHRLPLDYMTITNPSQLSHTPLVSIIIPQRGRPDRIKKCIELILKNTTYPNYEVVLVCDKDDIDSVYSIPENQKIRIEIDQSPTRRMFAGKINCGYKVSKAEYLVYLANDIEVGKNWLTEAMKVFIEAFSDGMGLIAFNDGQYNGELATHGLLSRKFAKKFLNDNIFHPEYIHYYCDAELTDIARSLYKYCYAPTSKVYHNWTIDAIRKIGENTRYPGSRIYDKHIKQNFGISLPRKDQHDICLQVWNRPEWTKRTLDSLDKNTNWNMINKFYIMDDTSEEETANILKNYKNSKKVYIREQFGSALNSFIKFIKLAETDLIFLYENDVLAPKNWNVIMQKKFTQNRKIVVIRGVSQDTPKKLNISTCHAGFRLLWLRNLVNKLETIENRWINGSEIWVKWAQKMDMQVKCVPEVSFDKLEYHRDQLPLIHKYFEKGWERRDIDYKYRLDLIKKFEK